MLSPKNIKLNIRNQTYFSRYKYLQFFLDFLLWQDRSSVEKYIIDYSLDKLKVKISLLDERLTNILKNYNFRENYSDKKLYWVMSTGRCGTRAIKKLFKNDINTFPVHRDLFNKEEKLQGNLTEKTNRTSVFHSLLNNALSDFEILNIIDLYFNKRIKTIKRAGDKTFIFATHHDVAWLPIIIKIFPQSQFLHLIRDPILTINSFYTKEQYTSGQILPVDNKTNKYLFHSRFTMICWYYFYVNNFIKYSLQYMKNSNRALTIFSENLFHADENCYKQIQHFFNTDLSYELFCDNFSHTINDKQNRNRSWIKDHSDWSPNMNKIYQIFRDTYSHSLLVPE